MWSPSISIITMIVLYILCSLIQYVIPSLPPPDDRMKSGSSSSQQQGHEESSLVPKAEPFLSRGNPNVGGEEGYSTRRTKIRLTNLHIGGLFPISGTGGWQGGQGCLPAARMALNDVNAEPYLLPGYQLVLHWNDSQCNPGLGANVLYDLIYNPPTKLLILGGCSIVCSTVAETAKMYNLVVLGYGSSSPALSNRERFATFFRTHPSATIHNPTRVELFKKFGWSRIAIILEAEEVFVTTGKDLESRCKDAGIEIVTRVSFLTDAADAVRSLARQDARIIVGMFYGGAARRVMCEAYKQNLYGKQYVWFLIGWYEDNWYMPVPGINCTKEEMLKVVEGHFTTEAIMLNQDQKSTISGLTATEWMERYHQELKHETGFEITETNKPEGYQEAPLAYDSVWAVALALNHTIRRLARKNIQIESFDYDNTMIMEDIKSSLEAVSFLGVSGLVRFTTKGDRIAWTQIEQMVDGKYNLLGFYDTLSDNLTWFSREHWTETGKPPADRTIIQISLKSVSNSLFMSLSAISAIGILLALLLIAFNFKFRNFRYIQLSYPIANDFMLLGIIICLVAVVFFGMDGKKIPKDYFIIMCHARAWFMSIGFSLYFGSMFAKTWICYRLSTSSSKNKKIKNGQVYLMLASFVGMDIVALIIWFFQSPMSRKVEIFELESPENTDEDIKIQPQLEHCDANMIWYGIIYGYKGLLLIFGLFLAYETRSAKVRQINDARLVGMSVYNVVILCMITGPVSLVISNQVNAHFAFIALTIIFCCFISMAMVFAPKISELIRKRGNMANQMNGVFQDTLTTKEDEEKLQRLISENEDLKAKIREKETQIEEVTRQLDQITKDLQSKGQSTKMSGMKKAVRIHDPAGDDANDEDLNQQQHKYLDVITIDPVSDSGYQGTSSRYSPELPEQYL